MGVGAESRRRELLGLLGELPQRSEPIRAELRGKAEREAYVEESLQLDLNGIEPVPALLTLPKLGQPPYPVVLFNHSHGGRYVLGKRELVEGNTYLQDPPYAVELARRGIAALCIDAWGFGERSGRSESAIFKEMLWRGRVMWGMMVYDSLRAIDYIASRSDLDSGRIGTIGMSMGSTMAWWTAALDERIRVCAEMCSLSDFQALIDTEMLDGHGIYYYVPSLLKHFTAAQINALTAPRPHLSLAGERDGFTPPAGLDRIDAELSRIYAEHGAPEAWRQKRYPCEHEELPAMRRELLAFLDRWL